MEIMEVDMVAVTVDIASWLSNFGKKVHRLVHFFVFLYYETNICHAELV